MRICVASVGTTLNDQVSKQFGRCPFFLIVDSGTQQFEAVANPAAQMSGGAGPAAVSELVNRGVEVVVAGDFGPKARQALDVAGVRSIKASGTVSEALEGLAD